MAGQKSRVKLNTDTGLLKLIAIAAMLIDHLGARVFPQYHVMRIIGRIAFPIFAYCIAAGCVYTHNIARYGLRVLLLGVLVQPLYTTAMGHQVMGAFDWAHNFYRLDLIWQHYYGAPLNILFTLAAGIAIIWTLRDKKYIVTALLLAFFWYVGDTIDYGLKGLLLITLFYVFIDRPLTSFVWVSMLMLYWGVPQLRGQFRPLSVTSVSTQFFAVMALPLIYLPMHTGLKINKYVFYTFYPAHLALIYCLCR